MKKVGAYSWLSPLSEKAECGDFFEIYEPNSTETFILFGDVSGHAHPWLGPIVKEAKAVSANFFAQGGEDLFKWFELIETLEGIQKIGSVLFLGKLNLETNMLSYLGVGDSKVYTWSHRTLTELPMQAGIVGIYLFETLAMMSVQLQPGCSIILCTDGLSVFDQQGLFESFPEKASPEQLVNLLSSQAYIRSNDDRLIAAIEIQEVIENCGDLDERVS